MNEMEKGGIKERKEGRDGGRKEGRKEKKSKSTCNAIQIIYKNFLNLISLFHNYSISTLYRKRNQAFFSHHPITKNSIIYVI